MRNKQLGGCGEKLRSIRNATHIVTRGGRVWSVPKYEDWTTPMLEHTFWLRKRLGLRKQTLAKVKRILE